LISLVFHPLMMPTYIHGLVFVYCTDLLPLTRDAKIQTLVFVFISTYMVPALATGMMWASGAISSITLEKRTDRLVPLLVTAVIYTGVSYIFMDFFSMARLLGLFMGAVALSVLLTALITRFWKISTHMVGVGGLVGFILAVVEKTQNNSLDLPLMGSFAVSGAVASSRLYLGAHTPKQISAGFFLGMVISWLAVYFFV
jgi:membrane-associated phospholipid phosphatase